MRFVRGFALCSYCLVPSQGQRFVIRQEINGRIEKSNGIFEFLIAEAAAA
jgi:hypothetical protein